MAKSKKRRAQPRIQPKPAATTALPTLTETAPTNIQIPNADSFFTSPLLRRACYFALCVLLLLGIGFRFVGLNWDDGYHLHPDERFLTMTVPALGWPGSWSAWFDTAHSPLNPFNLPNMGLFVYGQFPLIFAKFIAGRLNRDDYDGMLVLGRFLSACFDSGTVILVWLIARRWLGQMWGAVAGILIAFTALHVQHAHFYVVDTFATFWLVFAFWAALHWRDGAQVLATRRANIWAIICGIGWGLALACKISTILFAPILPLFLLSSGVDIRQSRARWLLCSGALLVLIATVFAFRVAHPMAFRGESAWWSLGGFLDLRLANAPANFWKSLAQQREITLGLNDVPWNLQWFGRRDYWWPLRNLLVWGVGWQLMLPAMLSIPLLFLARKFPVLAARSYRYEIALAALWVTIVFLYHAGQFSKFTRYYLLMTPFVALLGAWCAQQLWNWSRAQALAGDSCTFHSHPGPPSQAGANSPRSVTCAERGALSRLRGRAGVGAESVKSPNQLTSIGTIPQVLAALLFAAMLGGTVLWGAAVSSIYTRPNTRVAASQWMEAQPDGTRWANETVWDDALPLGDKARFLMLDLKLLDSDSMEKRQHLLDTLDQTQYVVISSPRMWASLPRIGPRYPLTLRYYQALFGGELGFVPVKQWASYPRLNLFGITLDLPDDNSEEALTVYDHPRVVLFQKTPAWSKERAAELLDVNLLQNFNDAPLKDLKAQGVTVAENALPQLPMYPDVK